MRGIVISITVAAAVGAAAFAALGRSGGEPAQTAPTPGYTTTQVTRQTLRETREADGRLGYGPVSTVVNRLQGTITWVRSSGEIVNRGEPLYKVDNKPVVAMHGAMPAYRPLREGTEGPDVRQLEANLQAMGYRGFTVDDDFTAGTADAVRRWQEDLGLDETGAVELGRVVFADGDLRVESLQAEAGAPAVPGQKVFSFTATAKVVTVELEPDDLRIVKAGNPVKVGLPDGVTVDGTVTKVSTVLRPGDRNQLETKVEVIVSLPDSGGFELASVDVTFTASQRENVLTVPVTALVVLGEAGYGLQVVESGATRYLPVKTGLFAGGRVEVSGDGVDEGLTVGTPR